MPERLGKYSLLKLLATGGMAEIWLARQRGVEGFEKLVVIKRILPHLSSNSEFVSMFLDEARLAAQLSHPHIVQIYELGKSDERHFIAMEFIHGENLRVINRAASKTGRGLSCDVSAKVISQSCEALYYAHTKTDVMGRPLGVVHRDISPQNILLSYEGQTKVVDFGIAKAASKCEETRTGVLKGKYSYMSPEQCRGEKLDGRSDIFALGIVLWELATGARLFKQSNELMILKAICEEPTPRPTQVRKEIPPELEAIILKALEKDPNDRYQDCHEMHLALEMYLREKHVQISSIDLSQKMRTLFAEKLEGWQKVIESLQEEDDEDLESELFSDLSGLIEGQTRSSQITSAPTSDSSGSRPLIAFSDDSSPSQARAASTPGPAPGTPPPTATETVEKKRGIGVATWILMALLVGVSGTWAWQTFWPARPDADTDAEVEHLLAEDLGTLVIESTPAGADVLVDGARRGSTPLTLDDITVGESKKVLVETDGYEPWSTEVLLESPGSRRRLSARLESTGELPSAVLDLRTDPAGATVLVDGETALGDTPLTLEIGPDRIGKPLRIEKDGFETETRVLDLDLGSHGRWDLVLREESTPEPSTTTAQAKRPPRRPRPTTTKRTTTETRTGTLSLNARPWCNISIDGEQVGQTPIVDHDVRAGRREVVCSNPQLGASRTVTIDVPPGGSARETITFEMGHLDVRVRPWAEVTVDGRSLGTTPFRPRPLPEGSYTVVLENPNFGFQREYEVTIRADETHTIRENLLE